MEWETTPMWSYWVDEKGGVIDALREQYPELIKEDPKLQLAMLQVEALEALIDKIMKEKGV